MEFPLISVIVPVYGVEKYLNKCIRSIVEQSYTNLEIILVEDGSPDRCGEICDEWAAKDGRIRVIHKENGGAGLARNVALEQARGELIGFIDSDDFIDPDMYRSLYQLIQDGADIAECEIVEVEGDEFLQNSCNGDVTICNRTEAMKYHISEMIFCQTPPNKLYKRRVIGDIRFPVGNLIDDEFFTYRVIANAEKLAHLNKPMYAYRQQAESVMHRPFSYKRFQGLDARRQRLLFLKNNMPELVQHANYCLYYDCVYFMQESLRWLKDNELENAKAYIMDTLQDITPIIHPDGESIKRKLFGVFAKISFEGSCRVLNFLQDIHILT